MVEEMNKDNIRTEYTAISAKLNQLPSFRFALAGFYVAGVGVIASMNNPTKLHFILLILITFALWLIDLRTRSLLSIVGKRGAEIERLWGNDGWITRMTQKDPGQVKVLWLRREYKLPANISHSLGLDILFVVVTAFSVIGIFWPKLLIC